MYNFKVCHVLPFMPCSDFTGTDETENGIGNLTDEIKNGINIENNIKINDELLINVSHELRTPLNIIYSAAQLIELYMKNDEESKNLDKMVSGINSIKQNSFRLMKIVNNILDLAKIESGRLNLNYSYINIVEVVEDVVQNVAETIRYKQISFTFDTDTEEKYVMVDVEYIERALLNILSNAVKFTGTGGKIFVNVTLNDDFVEIAVRDTGIGIEKKYLDNIFNRFAQVDKSLSKRAEGIGIGLKLSSAIIEAHGGNIDVFSKINKGSTFVIKLPCKKNDTLYTLYNNKVLNYDSLNEMIKIEFSDIDYILN